MGCVWTTFQLKTISKKIVAYVTQVSWSVSLNVTLSLSSIVQFSLCALLPHRANWTIKKGATHKNNRDKTRDQEKERNARKKENSSWIPACQPLLRTRSFLRYTAILICRRPWHAMLDTWMLYELHWCDLQADDELFLNSLWLSPKQLKLVFFWFHFDERFICFIYRFCIWNFRYFFQFRLFQYKI